MTDIEAAEALTERGVDCGIISAKNAPAAVSETFPAEDGREEEHLRTLTGGRFKNVTLKEGAVVLSAFHAGSESYPAAWLYENAAGQRFLCYAFSFFVDDRHAQLLTSYARQAQAIGALEWLQGGKKPAAIGPHHPELYMIVKDHDCGRAVGLWNCFADEIIAPVVTLDRAYNEVRFIGGASGHIEGNRVIFDSDIPAHSFAGFVVK